MNALKLQRTSESKNKDFYVQFEYPIGVRVISFTKGAVDAPKQCRVEVLLNLMDHFVVAERKEKVKPTIQTYVDDMKTIINTRQWFHDRKVAKTDICLDKLNTKILPALNSVLDEYELSGGVSDDMLSIVGVFKNTLEDK